MRILQVAASYLPASRYGGTIVSVHGLSRALAARGHDVHVFTTSVDGPRDSDVPHDRAVDVDGVHVWYFRSRRLRRLYWSPPMADALAARVRDFDVVHTHALFLWPLWAAARAAAAAGVPYVVSPRGMLEKALIARKSRVLKTAWIALVERRNLERAAAIHVTSRREADEIGAFGFRLPAMHEVPNGVEMPPPVLPPPSAEVARLAEDGPFVLFLGRVSWKKGLDRLVRALPYLPAGCRLIVAGNDEEAYRPRLEAEADRLNVRRRLVFAGEVDARDKWTLLAKARALVLPSYSENFGNVVVEAMAAGCPVVVTPEVGVAPVVTSAGAGWVVDGDPPVLGERLAALCADETLRREMGERGRLAAAREFAWDRVAERMETVYASARGRTTALP